MNRTFSSCCAVAYVMLFAGALTPSASAQNEEKRLTVPHITVSGQGEVKVRPDKMDVTIGVVTENRSSQVAASNNAQASEHVQSAVRKAGVADKDIQTVNYSVSPVYSENSPAPSGKQQPPRITGYRVYNQVRITVRSLSKIGDVLDAATGAGSNTIEGIALGLEDQKAAEGEALEKAVMNAHTKAEHMVKAAGTAMTGILEMSDNMESGPRPMMLGRMETLSAGAATPIAAGELTITASVTITYGLAK